MAIKKTRLNKIISALEESGLSQLVVTSTEDIYYLTDLWIEPGERILALYFDVAGEFVLFVNEIFPINQTSVDFTVSFLKDTDDPVSGLAKIAKPGKIGIDKTWPSSFLIKLLNKRNDLIPVLSSAVDDARVIKDSEEIEKMRKASLINDKVIQTAFLRLKEGVTETAVARFVNETFSEYGADKEGVQLVCFGKNAADPHHLPDNTKLTKGDNVVLDIFTPINRYWCDMTRTVFYGEANDKTRAVYEIVKKANESAIEIMRPGIPLSDFDKTARDIITDAGYGKYFTHRLGHGIGLSCHEPYDVSSASKDIIAAPGMVMSCEPGIYLPGEFGVRIEDLVLITETGCEVLNKVSKDLLVLD